MTSTTLWTQRTKADPRMLALTAGSDQLHDRRLMRWDLLGTKAHVAGLVASRLLTRAEGARLEKELSRALDDHLAGRFDLEPSDEDCHSAIERRMTERLGALGEKLQTGRSRNDQVVTALRLFLRHELLGLAERAARLIELLIDLAQRHRDVLIPGYTHTRRAMPSSIALWSGAHAAGLIDTLEALPALLAPIERSPLGSAAGYGAPLALDRKAAARALGFDAVESPVTAVQNGRGKIEAAVLFWCAQLAHDGGKLAGDVVTMSGDELGIFQLAPALATGSSLMPNKQNPDLFELARARAAALDADLCSVLALRSKLGSGYHRDFQLLKEPLMRGLDRCAEMLDSLSIGLPGLSLDRERCAAAIAPAMLATDEALLRAEGGMPFRAAYRQVAAELAQGRAPQIAAERLIQRRRSEGNMGADVVRPLVRRLNRCRRHLEQARRPRSDR